MFDNLSGRLSDAARALTGKGRLTEANIKDSLRQVRLALLEADVALPVVKTFLERIRERALGEEVGKSLSPGQALVKIIHAELVRILGSESVPLQFKAQPPVVILLAGLQGAGKTTTAAKLAKRLIDNDKKKVMLVSVDVHRPAAILQLQTLAGEGRSPGGAAEQETLRSHVRSGPDAVADALETEHRVKHEEWYHVNSVCGVSASRCHERSHRAGLGDPLLENLAVLGLAVMQQEMRVDRFIELPGVGIDAVFAKERV